MRTKFLFTIGYAGKSIEEFLFCLKKHGIDCLVDVRSNPVSKQFPDYNGNRLKKYLWQHGKIYYLPFGEYFGARRIEDEAYSNSYSLSGKIREQVDFKKVYKMNGFQEGVLRIENGLHKGKKICFMCSEKHPVDCHRFWMVAMYFYKYKSISIINIIDSATSETFEETVSQLDYDTSKRLFYNENSTEIEGSMLFKLATIKWIDWWHILFSQEDKLQSKIDYANCKIGYIRGNDYYD